MIAAKKLAMGAARPGTVPTTALIGRLGDDAFIWDAADWSLDKSFLALSCGDDTDAPVTQVYVNPDKTWFVTNGSNGTGVYDISTGAQLYYKASYEGTPHVSPDGSKIAICDNSKFIIVDTSDWSESGTTTTGVSLYTYCQFSNDGNYMAVGGADGDVIIFETATWTAYSSEYTPPDENYHYIVSMRWSDDDSKLSITCKGTSPVTVHNIFVLSIGTTLTRDWYIADGQKRQDTVWLSDSVLLVCMVEKFQYSGFQRLNAATGAVLSSSTDTDTGAGDLYGMAVNNEKDLAVFSMFSSGGKMHAADPDTLDYIEAVDSAFGDSGDYYGYALQFY